VRDRRLAWFLVRLYPPRFRRDVGLGLVDAIEDRMRQRRAAGASGFGVVVPAILDTLRNAPAAWFVQLQSAEFSVRNSRRPMIDKLRQDARYALRRWKRRPGFAFVAILTLALGIGATTAMFSLFNAVLLRPLPYADADRLVAVWARTSTTPRSIISYDEYVAVRDQSKAFDTVALWLGQSVTLTGVTEPQRILGNFVSGSFFEALQLKAERGRLFDESESRPGSAKSIVVLSRLSWERQFNSDPDIVGKAITLNGAPLVVVGVLATPYDRDHIGVDGWLTYDAFLPVGLYPTPAGVSRASLNATPSMLSLGRLKHRTPVETANAALETISRGLEAANPQAERGRTVFVVSAQEDMVGEARTPLLLLLASIGCVLFIACLNVSNLLLARAVDRQREIALRAALGATRADVARQLGVEASLLGVLSASLGLLVGRWSLQALVAWRPAGVSLPASMPLDGHVLFFTIGTAALCTVVCGLAPSLRAVRSGLIAGLQGRRTTGAGRMVREFFVVVEIALSVALLAVSGLLIQSLWALQAVNVGFDPQNIFTLQFRLPATKYRTPEDIARFFEAALAQVRAVHGVESAALVRSVPMSGNFGDTPFTPEGREFAKGTEPRAGQNLITPDYFNTMRIPMKRGRDFTDRDNLQAPPVVIVNESLARTIWPGDDPIGKRLTVPVFKRPATIVGVVGDVKHRTPTEPAQPQLYLAHYQSPLIFSSLVARTAVPPLTLTRDIRRAVWSVDHDQPMWSITAVDTIVEGSRGSARFLAVLLATLAGVALLLAAVGIYGVTSYTVTERTHEIGIRMALGASAERVMGEIMRRGSVLTIIALALGIPAGVLVGRVARSLLFGVTPGAPATFAAAAFILSVISLVACYVPARRATRVNPVVALAAE
jgi:putative ABC transport system permease protein